MSPVVREKKEKHIRVPDRYILLIVTLACAGLIAASYLTPVFTGPLYAVSEYLVIPFQEGISAVGSYLIDRSEALARMRRLEEENATLRAEIRELNEKNAELSMEQYELTSLRELYALDSRYAGYRKTGARIIARDAGNYFHSFIVDKGEEDGILVNMNVLADSGLVGRITAVGPHWARVMSIIDDESNVASQVLSTQDTLIVSGSLAAYNEGYLSFSRLIDREEQVAPGDKVVTGNISGKYQPGILIGYIAEITKDSNNLTWSGRIVPAVDFEHLDTVLIVLDVKDSTMDTND